MSISAIVKSSIQFDGVATEIISTVSAQVGERASVLVAASQTDQLLPVSFAITNLQAVLISADQDCTIETNSSSSAAQTLTMKANKPYLWVVNSPFALQITTAVTAMYITTGVTATNVNVVSLVGVGT